MLLLARMFTDGGSSIAMVTPSLIRLPMNTSSNRAVREPALDRHGIRRMGSTSSSYGYQAGATIAECCHSAADCTR
jgi:hypothetical protein